MMKKAELIATIVKYDVNTFTSEELDKMKVKELNQILGTLKAAQGELEPKNTEKKEEEAMTNTTQNTENTQAPATQNTEAENKAPKLTAAQKELAWAEAVSRAVAEHGLTIRYSPKINRTTVLDPSNHSIMCIEHTGRSAVIRSKKDMVPEGYTYTWVESIPINPCMVRFNTIDEFNDGLAKYVARMDDVFAVRKEKADAEKAAKEAAKAAEAAKKAAEKAAAKAAKAAAKKAAKEAKEKAKAEKEAAKKAEAEAKKAEEPKAE